MRDNPTRSIIRRMNQIGSDPELFKSAATDLHLIMGDRFFAVCKKVHRGFSNFKEIEPLEDFTQEIIIRLWKRIGEFNLDKYDDEKALQDELAKRVYVMGTTYLIDKFRAHRRNSVKLEEIFYSMEKSVQPDFEDSPRDHIYILPKSGKGFRLKLSEFRQSLEKAKAMLDTKKRRVLDTFMPYHPDIPPREVKEDLAAELNVEVDSLRAIKRRALLELSKMIDIKKRL